MRIIILGSLLALIGLASTAQASDWHSDRGTRMHHESHADDERHERHEYRDRSRRHDAERRHGSRERDHEFHERSQRR